MQPGADPTNSSSQGRPQHYTSDPAILELLHIYLSKMSPGGMPAQPPAVYPPPPQDPNADPSKQYYAMPPAGSYGYYPPGPMMPQGMQGYYPPPPPQGAEQQWPGGPGILPPPDVARYIPCRYYPACRYGDQCLFLHPQTPFYPPPPPHAQYAAPYDPMAQQGYPQNYYTMPPPSFQPPPNGVPQHMNAMSPQSGPIHTPPPPPHMGHVRSGSEIVSPIQGHFSPNGVPPPPPVPYGAMSPVSPSYSHPNQQGPAPLSIPPIPQHPQQIPPQGPTSPQISYNPQSGAPTPTSPFVVRQDAAGQYPSHQGMNGRIPFPETNGSGPKSPPLQPQSEGFNGPSQGYRDNMGHGRRGSVRRGSFAGRKPPCLFYPSGRCKNGWVFFSSLCFVQ